MSRPAAVIDYYRILGVEAGANPEALRKAYHELVLQLHPDQRPPDKSKDEAFCQVVEAWRVLGDPQRRQAYDRARRRDAASAPRCSLGYELGHRIRELLDAGKQAKENLLAELARDAPREYPEEPEDPERKA